MKGLQKYYDDPLGFVMMAFPWSTEPLIQQVEMPKEYQEKYGVINGPDQWAIDFLERLQNLVQAANDSTREDVQYPLQFSTASGHGIGKTTLVAWLILWIMCTRPHCNGVVTANTIEQLRSKTWSELSKWHNMCVAGHMFEFSAGRGNMKLCHMYAKETWKCLAQTSKEENSESFAGLHAASSSPFYIFDEASAVPDKIFDVREGGTTDGEGMTFDFGNPTRNSGMFFENTEGKFAHNFHTAHIDSRTVFITSKETFERWVRDRGEDSDFVKVRVRGVFPSVGMKQFINSDDVRLAMERDVVKEEDYAPLVIGVDIARYGDDDTVIYPRIGRDARSFTPIILSGLDTVQVTGRVIDVIREFATLGKKVSGLFVDGGGLGGGVVDMLRHLGYSPIEVLAQHRCNHPEQYRYKTDETWGELRDHLRNGLVLPDRRSAIGAQLYSELTQREYDYTIKGQISLESKKIMKERGLDSPNIADALTLTYASLVAPTIQGFGQGEKKFAQHEYNPLGPDIAAEKVPDIFKGRYG